VSHPQIDSRQDGHDQTDEQMGVHRLSHLGEAEQPRRQDTSRN
jgi:hypothetical protein